MRKFLQFSTNSEILRVAVNAVVFISAEGNYSSITTANGECYMITMQLCKVEELISLAGIDSVTTFIRIGKSLIANREFITYINPSRKKLVVSDGHTFKHEITASKLALKQLKTALENEETL